MLRMTKLVRAVLPGRCVVGRVATPIVTRTTRVTFPAINDCIQFPSTFGQRHFSRSTVSFAASTDTQPDTGKEETFEYQAEVDRLMDMIVNSLYSNKEVFMRELVSNASDALDKMRILSLTDQEALKSGAELEIKVKADPEARTITIEDTGVGMSKDDLLSSLGTIARSGTAKFAEAMKAAKTAGDSNLIGQFGVGFYSSFLVADRVTVQTKSNDDVQWAWESAAGSHKYTIKEEADGDLKRGTRITLFIKEDCEDLVNEKELQRLIKTYSEFISFPISVWSSVEIPKQVEDAAATAKKQEEADAKAKEDGKEAAEAVEPVMKTEYEKSVEWKKQNESKPIWTRSSKDVTDEEYNTFFKQTFREFMDPMARSHFNVEGTYEFSGLLFIPGMAPFDEMQRAEDSKKSSIRLFVKRVFISDQFDEQLLPRYLSFVKGIVDSSDLPLNVSREILQESRVVRVIRKQLVKRALDMVAEVAGRSEEEYENKFWNQFGRNLKLGVVDDKDNQDKLAGLIRFKSTKSGDVLTGLDDYISRMKESQKGIYYIATESDALAADSPFVEKLQKKGLEVLYFTEPIDEWMAAQLNEYEGKKLIDVTKDGLELDDDEKENMQAAETRLKAVQDFLKTELEGKITGVKVSARLTDSPCILVTSKMGWSANMQRIMKSQPMGDNKALEYMKGEKILEINPEHPVISSLNNLVQAEKESSQAKEIAGLMYDTALLTSGFDVESPKEYASKVYGMMGMALSADSDAPVTAESSLPTEQPAPPATPEAASKTPKKEAAAPKKEQVKAETIEADQVIEEK